MRGQWLQGSPESGGSSGTDINSVWKKRLMRILVAAVCMVWIGLFSQPVSASGTGGYIFPDSDARYLTNEDVAGLSAQLLNYGKNEIYARRGRKFRSGELTAYFGSQTWYQGTIDAAGFSESVFNEFERANAYFLSKAEHAAAPQGYELDRTGYSFDAVQAFIVERYGQPQMDNVRPAAEESAAIIPDVKDLDDLLLDEAAQELGYFQVFSELRTEMLSQTTTTLAEMLYYAGAGSDWRSGTYLYGMSLDSQTTGEWSACIQDGSLNCFGARVGLLAEDCSTLIQSHGWNLDYDGTQHMRPDGSSSQMYGMGSKKINISYQDYRAVKIEYLKQLESEF